MGRRLITALAVALALAGCLGPRDTTAEIEAAVLASDPSITKVTAEGTSSGLDNYVSVIVNISDESLTSEQLRNILLAVGPLAEGYDGIDFGAITPSGDPINLAPLARELALYVPESVTSTSLLHTGSRAIASTLAGKDDAGQP